MWPLVEDYTAKRKSQNHERGDVYTKNIESITKKIYKHYLINYVIPAIKSKWPRREKGSLIYIQQDNARPHVCEDDKDVLSVGEAGGWNIRMLCQPPNSPDFNVLDLGFFRAIQSIQLEREVWGVEKLIDEVQRAFAKMTPKTLNAVFLTLQSVMMAVMEAGGSKNRLERENKLPIVLKCSDEVLRKALALVQ